MAFGEGAPNVARLFMTGEGVLISRRLGDTSGGKYSSSGSSAGSGSSKDAVSDSGPRDGGVAMILP